MMSDRAIFPVNTTLSPESPFLGPDWYKDASTISPPDLHMSFTLPVEWIRSLNASHQASTSGNITDENDNYYNENGYSPFAMVLIVFSLLVVIVGTIIGNVLVCVAVCLVRKLRRPYNYLLVSLAVSDLCVAILVMPMALLLELLGNWRFGPVVCDVWVSFDVLSCTASILNLCMISVDRYLAITKPLEYGVKRTPKRMVCYIVFVWLGAAFVSVPPVLILGNEHGEGFSCQVCQNFYYQLYATFGSFYIPLAVMVTVYYKIFCAAKRIVNEERKAQAHLKQVEETDKAAKHQMNSTKNTALIPAADDVTTTQLNAISKNSVVEINNGEVETKLLQMVSKAGHNNLSKVVSEALHTWPKHLPSSGHMDTRSLDEDNKHIYISRLLEVPTGDVKVPGNDSPASTTTTCGSSWSESQRKDSKPYELISSTTLCDAVELNRTGVSDSPPGTGRRCLEHVPNSAVKDHSHSGDANVTATLEKDPHLTTMGETLVLLSSLEESNIGVCQSHPQIHLVGETHTVIPYDERDQTPKDKDNLAKAHSVPHNGRSRTEDYLMVGDHIEDIRRKSSGGQNSSKRKLIHVPHRSRLKITLAKERKASTTLGIIMSAFIICWLPFFVLALVRPFLNDPESIPATISSLFLWLGYANSLLNPIIYATLNKDFRKPFQEILCLRCSSLNILMREEFYHSQYGPDTPTHSNVRSTAQFRDSTEMNLNTATDYRDRPAPEHESIM